MTRRGLFLSALAFAACKTTSLNAKPAMPDPLEQALRDHYIGLNESSYVAQHGRAAWEDHLASLAAPDKPDPARVVQYHFQPIPRTRDVS